MATPFDPRRDHQALFVFPPPSPPPSPPPTQDPEWQTQKRRSKKIVEEEEKPAHVLWDWDNAPLPREYEIETLYHNVEEALRIYDSKLRVKSFIGCGEYFSLALKEEPTERRNVAGDRYKFLSGESHKFTIFKVPSRVRRCMVCGEYFPNLAEKSDHDRNRHYILNYQDQHSRVMDVGDAILAREMKKIQFEAKSPGVILLISADKDYASSLQFLIERGWNVLIAEPDLDKSSILGYWARAIWKWASLVLGRRPHITQLRVEERKFSSGGYA